MKNLWPNKLKLDSLFLRLFFSFLIIILLLVSFNFFSFSFFQNNIRNEIIQNNNANLKSTTESFENHFTLVNELVLRLYMNDQLQLLLTNSSINYAVASQVRRDIRSVVSNELLYMDEIILYLKKDSFIIDKGGSTRAETMFTKFYQSDNYPFDFWENMFAENYLFRIYPSATFSELAFNEIAGSHGQLFPIIVKNKLYPDSYFVAFINTKRMMDAYHNAIDDHFYILDSQGTTLYSSNNTIEHTTLQLNKDQSYEEHGGNYYFYKKGMNTGLTYINVVPNKLISSQIDRLNYTLISLLIVAVVISIVVSLLLSIRINNPVKEIIQSIKQFNTKNLTRSRIKEFKMISEEILQMNEKNQTIHRDLADKKSLLKYYAYTNKLKNIHSNFQDLKELFVADKPFLILLFELKFKNKFYKEVDADPDKVAYFILEYVRCVIAEKYSDSSTFPIENDKILSLLFTEANSNNLQETMDQLKKVFDLDQEFYYLTIAVGYIHQDSSEFNVAYEQVTHRLKQRQLIDQTQVISSEDKDYLSTVGLVFVIEKEFSAYLQAGNKDELIQWSRKIIKQMEKRNAVAADYLLFGEQLCRKIMDDLAILNIKYSTNHLDELSKQLMNCHNIQQLGQFFEQILSESAELVQQKKEEHDHITSFVSEYIEKHYEEEITLDMLAEKMNITGGYLSSYYKAKTGGNLIDYLNEVRIIHAKEKLLQSNSRIQDIAKQVGYQNLNSFNRMFKKLAGLTPSEFRQTNTNK